jgi:hypothetical protein
MGWLGLFAHPLCWFFIVCLPFFFRGPGFSFFFFCSRFAPPSPPPPPEKKKNPSFLLAAKKCDPYHAGQFHGNFA